MTLPSENEDLEGDYSPEAIEVLQDALEGREGGDMDDAELAKLFGLVDEFALAMKERLQQKHLEGYKGWDGSNWNPLVRSVTKIYQSREEHEPSRKARHLVDAANFILFDYGRITQQEAQDDQR